MAPRARREEPFVLAPDPSAAAQRQGWPALARPLIALWAVMIAGLVAFLVFGSVRIGAGFWIGRRMSIRDIWSRFLVYLADQGASPAIVVAVTAAAAVTAVGVGFALWLALGLEDAPTESPPDDMS
jgi:hypothetical protein